MKNATRHLDEHKQRRRLNFLERVKIETYESYLKLFPDDPRDGRLINLEEIESHKEIEIPHCAVHLIEMISARGMFYCPMPSCHCTSTKAADA